MTDPTLSPLDQEEQRMRANADGAAPAAPIDEPMAGEDSPLAIADQQQKALRRSLESASKVNPDQYAETQRVSRFTGLTPEAVEAHKEKLAQREAAANLDKATEKLPLTRRMFTENPEAAALGQDDLPALGTIENVVQGWKAGRAGAKAGVNVAGADTVIEQLQRFKEYDQKIADGKPMVTAIERAYARMSPDAKVTAKEQLQQDGEAQVIKGALFNRQAQAATSKMDPAIQKALNSNDIGDWWEGFSTHPLDFLATVSAQSLGTNPTRAIPGAGILAGVISGGITEYANALTEAMQNKGVDTASPDAMMAALQDKKFAEEIRQAALIKGSIITTGDAIGIGGALKKFSPFEVTTRVAGKQIAKKVGNELVDIGIDTAVEGVQGAGGEILGSLASGGPVQLGEVMAELTGGAGMAGANAVATIGMRVQAEQAQAKKESENVRALLDAAANSKLRQRDPQAFHKFVSDATAEGLDQAYVDGGVLKQLVADGGEDARKAMLALPGVAAQLDEAIYGSDVAIPMADLATVLAGTPLAEALVDHVRTTENGKSYAELAQQAAQIEADAAQTEAMASEPQKWKESQQRVSDAIYTQIISTGTVGHEQARVSAALASAMFATQAGRQGMLPHELAAKYQLGVTDETGKSPTQAWNGLVDDLEAAKERGDTGAVRRITVQLEDLKTQVDRDNLKQAESTKVTFDEELADKAKEIFEGLDVFTQSTMTEDIMGVIPGKPLNMDRPERAEQATAAREAFEPFREMLRSRYGDEVTLWRADSPRKSPASRTAFFGDETLARQFTRTGGSEPREAKPYRVRVDDIEHAMIGPDGTLHQIAARIPEGGLVPHDSGFDTQRPSHVLEQSLGARLATNVNPQVDPVTDTDGITLDHMRDAPEVLAKNVATILGYTGMAKQPKGAKLEDKIQAILEFMSDNLLWLYDQVPEAVRERSKLWYVGANRISNQMAARYGVEHRQMAAALASLSPQRDWYQNVSLAERVADVWKHYQNVPWDADMEAALPTLHKAIDTTKSEKQKHMTPDELAADRAEKHTALDRRLDQMRGKTYAEIGQNDPDYVLRAQYVRVWDRAKNDGSYRVITPEGAFGEFVRNNPTKAQAKKGEPGKQASVGWGSNGTIANVLSVLDTNDIHDISVRIGKEHKVRNFYNNIFNPEDARFSTIDTHAVAALWLQPFGGSDAPVKHNLGGAASSSVLGLSGTYAFGQDAHQFAAAQRGVLPREMQSITWEAVRGLFTNKSAEQKRTINAIWEQYRAGTITVDDARTSILQAAGGIDTPTWNTGGAAALPGTVGGNAPDSEGDGQERGLTYARPIPVAGAPAGQSAGAVPGGTGVPDAPGISDGVPGQPSLTGLPTPVAIPGVGTVEVGAFHTAHDVARKVAERTGIPYNPITTYQKVDKARAARIAQAYQDMEHKPHDPEVQAAYDAMIRETLIQYEEILKTGLQVEFIDFAATGDPYAASPRLATEDVRSNNHMWVFPTDDGFGSSGADVSGNPLLAETSFIISGRSAKANDIFRVVHDYFGHIKDGVGFRADGEENAWRSHSRMYSDLARKAMTSETRGQNSWVNFGPFGEKNRTANAGDTTFADQKTGLLPDWVVTEGAEDPAPTLDQSQPAGFSGQPQQPDAITVNGIHYGNQAGLTSLSGDRSGTGIKGAEKNRLADSKDPRIKKRVYFYDQKGDTLPTAETGLGADVYRQTLSNILGPGPVRESLWAASKGEPNHAGVFDQGEQANNFESAVIDAGYDGYTSGMGAVVVLNTDVPVDSLGKAYDIKKAAAAPPAPLAQSARGTVTFGAGIAKDGGLIRLMRGADATTFVHELGHFYLEMLTDMALQPDAPPAVLNDLRKTLDWFGVDLATWAKQSINERRENHEKFARGFEAYLFEGKAPTPELRGAFSRFRSWMLQVYKSMVGLNVTLTPEVRGIFDRMLATNEQLQDAAQGRAQAPIFSSPEEAGMTHQEYLDYLESGAEATQDAVAQLQTRQLRDMKWLSNAKGILLKKLQAEANDKRAQVEAEVRSEFAGRPVALATQFIKTGALPEGQNNAAIRDALDLLAGGKTKLSTEDLKTIFGAEPAAVWRYLPGGMVAKDDGANPDTVAQVFGFKSGEAMVRAIVANQDPESEISIEIDARMMERYGDINSPQALDSAVNEALQNAAHARFLATELAALQEGVTARRQTGTTTIRTGEQKGKTRAVTVNAILEAAKQYAAKIVARTRVRDLRAGKYTAAANRAATQAVALLKKGDHVGAIDAKRNQILNSRVARETAEARDAVQAIVERLQKLATNPPDSIDAGYVEQINRLLERFNLRKSSLRAVDAKNSLAAWIEEQRDMGVEPPISEKMADEAFKTHYSELTVEQIHDLDDSIKGIVHLGRLKKKLLTAKDDREFADIIADMVGSIEQHGGKRRKRQYTPTPDGVKAVRGFLADHRKLASVLRVMDGVRSGVLWERFMRPLNEAADHEARLHESSTVAIGKILGDVMSKRGGLGKKVHIAGIDQGLTLEQRIAVALNQGNEGNKQRLRDGHGWSDAQVQEILNTLDRTDWLAVQGLWDHINSYWAPIQEKTKRVGGVSAAKVDAESFTVNLPDGSQMSLAGGYYPAAADTELSSVAESHAEADLAKAMMRGAYTRSMTKRGFLEARAKTNAEPIRLSLDPLFKHLNDVTHDLTHHEWLIDANRILNSKDFQTAVRDFYGPEALKVIRDAVKDIAIGNSKTTTAFENLLMKLRNNVSASTMGLSVTTALMQPFGIFQSVVRVGPRWVMKGVGSALSDAAHLESSMTDIGEKSSFMRLRAKTMNRELAELHGNIKKGRGNGAVGTAAKIFDASKFALMQKMQMLVDVPTWLGAEARALSEGNDAATAVAMADQAVIDAQGSGMTKDLARVQRGSPLAKMMTIFYSYFSTTYNLTAEQARKRGQQVSDGHVISAAIGATSDLVLLYVLPAILPALLLDLLKGSDAPDDEEEWLKYMAKKMASFAMAPVVYLRELSGLVEGYSYSGPAGFRLIGDIGAGTVQAAQGEVDTAAATVGLKVLGDLTGLPTSQVARTLKGWNAYINEDAPVSSILFGPPQKAK